jgi:hypothetical protein
LRYAPDRERPHGHVGGRVRPRGHQSTARHDTLRNHHSHRHSADGEGGGVPQGVLSSLVVCRVVCMVASSKTPCPVLEVHLQGKMGGDVRIGLASYARQLLGMVELCRRVSSRAPLAITVGMWRGEAAGGGSLHPGESCPFTRILGAEVTDGPPTYLPSPPPAGGQAEPSHARPGWKACCPISTSRAACTATSSPGCAISPRISSSAITCQGV